MHDLTRTASTLALSAVGAYSVGAVGVPGGMLSGGALIVASASMLGMRTRVPEPLRNILFVCVGLLMGTSISPDSLRLISQWPISLAALAVELAIIVALCGLVLRRCFGFSPSTAYLSTFPGHLSFIVALASAGMGNPRQITIIQVERVMALTLFFPLGALFVPLEAQVAVSSEPATLPNLALIAATCTFAGWVLWRSKVPAGFILGALFAATTMRLTGIFPGSLPVPIEHVTSIGMGALIGSRLSGISRKELLGTAWGGLAVTLITLMVTTSFAWVLRSVVSMPMGQLWLAMSPGSLEAMGALGVALGYDSAFIAAHHVFRIFILSLSIPLLVFFLRGRPF